MFNQWKFKRSVKLKKNCAQKKVSKVPFQRDKDNFIPKIGVSFKQHTSSRKGKYFDEFGIYLKISIQLSVVVGLTCQG